MSSDDLAVEGFNQRRNQFLQTAAQRHEQRYAILERDGFCERRSCPRQAAIFALDVDKAGKSRLQTEPFGVGDVDAGQHRFAQHFERSRPSRRRMKSARLSSPSSLRA